jgi:hypothetical protein
MYYLCVVKPIKQERKSSMKIVNPLYDQAFKYLMENNKFARKVLSIILDVEVEEVFLEQQETHVADKEKLFNLFRMDFKAQIKEADGSRKTVLIEIQKSKYSTDIGRFRNYLGANYMSAIRDVNAIQEPVPEPYSGYPIITIYILGYNLPDLPYMAVTVNREVINSVNKEKLDVRSFFIEHLTHQSHIIQVRRLPEKRRTRLERFLMFFNQRWVSDSGFILELPEIPAGFSDMAKYLQVPLLDDEFRRQLRAEQEIDLIFDQQEHKFLTQILVLEEQINQAEKRKNEAERRKDEAEKRQEEAEKRKEEAEKKKEEAEKKKEEAEKRKEEAEKKKEEADRRKEEAERRKEEAERRKEEAERRKEEAERKQVEAERKQVEAERKNQEAQDFFSVEQSARKQMALKLALVLYRNGIPTDQIIRETGLTSEEIINNPLLSERQEM